MGIDCGFDIFPRLERTPSNKKNFDLFLQEVLEAYEAPSELDVEVKKDEAYIEFVVGEHPRIPHRFEYFMRFSSKISGSCSGAEPVIREVYKIAKRRFGDCVHFWTEMCESDDHRQWGFYDWDQIRNVEEEMRNEIKNEQKGGDGQDGEVSKIKDLHDSQFKKSDKGKKAKKVNDEAEVKDRWHTISSVPGKGQGVIALAKIPKGTRILAERPIFKVPRDTNDLDALTQLVAKRLKSLDKETQRAFFALHNAKDRNSGSPLLGIARTNALPLGPGAPEGGVFLEASRINHSCCNNAQNTWNANLNQLTIHVFKDVEEGEEITISYLDGYNTYDERQSRLKPFNFECTCALCSLSLEQRQSSDNRLREMSRLHDSIGDGKRIVNTPLACLRDAHKLLRLLEEETIQDAVVAGLYYDAFQVVIANGDEARAKVFAERAYEIRMVSEGDDSPTTIRLKKLAESPRGHQLYGEKMKWRQSTNKVPRDLDVGEFEKWLWRE